MKEVNLENRVLESASRTSHSSSFTKKAVRLVASGLAALALTFGCSRKLHGEDYYVNASVSESGDGKTSETAFKYIQEAIDTSTHGDTVTVMPGVYIENIYFGGKNITLTSTNPYDWQTVENTIIDGNQNGSVVTFDGTEDESCTLRGFTVRNGSAESGGGVRGGDFEKHTLAAIENNKITNNLAWEWWPHGGGGIAFCDGVIKGNTVSDNRSDECGGGLCGCDGIVQNNIIEDNFAWKTGGGLYDCNWNISNNVIKNNSTRYGGGLYGCDGIIQNNIIDKNFAETRGGGLHRCEGSVLNNTITRNSAGLEGSGVFRCTEVRNCIMWGNIAPENSQIGDSTVTYSCIQDWIGGGEGNISEDPLLDSNYCPFQDSPCIDAGKNEEWMQNTTDITGNPRILYGKNSLTVDMGAYEHFSFKVIKIEKNPYNAQITWTSLPQKTFVVWSLDNIADGDWKKEAEINAGGALSSWIDNYDSVTNKFYRIEKQELSK